MSVFWSTIFDSLSVLATCPPIFYILSIMGLIAIITCIVILFDR